MAHFSGALRHHHPHPAVPLTERLKGAIGFFGIHVGEEPHYRVIHHDGPREIRQYRPFLIARVTVPGDFKTAGQRAFQRLADYIFGRNLGRRQMAMSAPVFQEKTKDAKVKKKPRERHSKVPLWQEKTEGGWRMCFVLPSALRRDEVPAPFDRGIEILQSPAHKVASLTYTGRNTPERIAQKAKCLRAWIEDHNGVAVGEEFRVAQYDPPFTLPFFRRNEIHIVLQKKDQSRSWDKRRVKGNALV